MRYDRVVQSYVMDTEEFTIEAFMNRFQEQDKSEAEEFLFDLVKKGVLDYAPGFVYKYVGEPDPDNEGLPMVYQAFFIQVKTVTKLNVCKELDLSLEDAEMLLESLVEQGLCAWDSEFVFHFTGNEEKAESDAPSFSEFFRKNVMDKQGRVGEKNFITRFAEQEHESDDDDEEEDKKISFFDDDDDDDDDDFGRRGNTYNRPLVLSHTLCSDVLEELEELEDKERMKGLTVEEATEKLSLEKRKKLLQVALLLGGTECFDKMGDEYVWYVDASYPDDSPMQFRLYYDQGVCLSDNGLTTEFMQKYYNTSRERISRDVNRILENYSILQEGDELYLKVDPDNARVSMFFLFSAVEQIVNGLSNNLLGIVEADIEARCASVMKEIIFGGAVQYEMAKEKAEALLADAETNGTEEDKTVYRNVLDTLQDVTEENFERFVERVIIDSD